MALPKKRTVKSSIPVKTVEPAAEQSNVADNVVSGSIWNRVKRRVTLSAALLALMYLYFYYKENSRDQYRVMASVGDHISGPPLAQQLPCAQDYSRERKLFPKCAPTRCGRFVSDSIVTEQEAMEMRILAETVFAVARPSGGVAIFDLNSGALSNGTNFVNLYQILRLKNSTLIKQKSLETFRAIKNKLAHNIAIHFGVTPDQFYLTSPVFLTKITNAKAVTLNDQYWHPHVDKLQYGSFIYTSLLYLSTYQEEFTGGRFIYLDAHQNVTIEPRMGRVSAFTSSTENSHQVEPVSWGARFALTVPFTCTHSHAIKDPSL